MKKTLMLVVGLVSSLAIQAQITIYEQNSKFGLKDASGEILVRAEFDNMTSYKEYSYYAEGTPIVFVGNKGGTKTTTTVVDSIWGYTDDNYTYAVTGTKEREFSVVKGGSFYLFNSTGQ